MNRHPYGQRDITVAAEVITRIYSDVDTNHGISAVAVLDAVMVDRHRRDGERRKVWCRRVLWLAAQGAGHVALMLLLVACGVFGTLLYLGVFPAR